MKAEELMIGDYVHVKPSGMLMRVAAVHRKKVAYHSCANKLVWVRKDLLEPIPLTPEILEKNGIKWLCTEPSGRKTYCCNKPVVQCTYIPNSGWFINVGAGGSIKVRFVEISKIQYVHELQHALRLCNIDKEIVL